MGCTADDRRLAVRLMGPPGGRLLACLGIVAALAVAAPGAVVPSVAAEGAAAPPAVAAPAAVRARLHASFSPDRLGASTTIGFGFTLHAPEGMTPPPLTSIVLRMPAGMNYLHSTLGLATCTKAQIIAHGSRGCPADSLLGSGSSYVEVPFGKTNGREWPQIQVFNGRPHDEHTVVLFYVNGLMPVFAQLVFKGELLPDRGIYGTKLKVTVPLVESITDGPDVSIVRVHATLGPKHLLYKGRAHGHIHYFHPHGIEVPRRCPKGGFPFAADFAFQGGVTAQARTKVPCPGALGRARRRAAHEHRP